MSIYFGEAGGVHWSQLKYSWEKKGGGLAIELPGALSTEQADNQSEMSFWESQGQ